MDISMITLLIAITEPSFNTPLEVASSVSTRTGVKIRGKRIKRSECSPTWSPRPAFALTWLGMVLVPALLAFHHMTFILICAKAGKLFSQFIAFEYFALKAASFHEARKCKIVSRTYVCEFDFFLRVHEVNQFMRTFFCKSWLWIILNKYFSIDFFL